jgi:hypothetical protein
MIISLVPVLYSEDHCRVTDLVTIVRCLKGGHSNFKFGHEREVVRPVEGRVSWLVLGAHDLGEVQPHLG